MDDPQRLIQLAKVIKALAQPFRLAIVQYLRAEEHCVCDIAQAVGAERSNVSRHLAVLANAGVVTSRKKGLLVLYRLRTPCILSIFECVAGVMRADSQAVGSQSCASVQPVQA